MPAHRNWKGGPISALCAKCGASFTFRRNGSRRYKYCSRKCFALAHSIRMSGRGNPSWRNDPIKKTCLQCQSVIVCAPCLKKRKMFCSEKCRAAHNFIGNKNPNWKGGITPENQRLRHLPKYFLWRKTVFERDNYTCQWCQKRGGRLHADHLRPFALFPDLRFTLSNGRTLCLACHKKTPSYCKGKGASFQLELV